MSPVLGIIASQMTGHLVTSSFESIATVTVGSGGTSTITFSSIPSTYTHLQIRAFYLTSGTNTSSPYEQMGIKINGNTTNLIWHQLRGNGTSAIAEGNNIDPPIRWSVVNRAVTNGPGGIIIDVLDYKDTNKYKTIRGIGGFETNGYGTSLLGSGFWSGGTNAITSILLENGTNSWNQYSHFALYGIR